MKKNKIKWYLLSFFCFFIIFLGFIKVNIECNKRNEQVIENMKKNSELNTYLRDEYKSLYSIQDNCPVKIFYSNKPFNLKILLKEYEIVLNSEVFENTLKDLGNNIKSIIN